jgi:hypothetical protein
MLCPFQADRAGHHAAADAPTRCMRCCCRWPLGARTAPSSWCRCQRGRWWQRLQRTRVLCMGFAAGQHLLPPSGAPYRHQDQHQQAHPWSLITSSKPSHVQASSRPHAQRGQKRRSSSSSSSCRHPPCGWFPLVRMRGCSCGGWCPTRGGQQRTPAPLMQQGMDSSMGALHLAMPPVGQQVEMVDVLPMTWVNRSVNSSSSSSRLCPIGG